MQLWPIYHYKSSADKLRLLPNGVLRHYFDNQSPNEFELENEYNIEENKLFYDYPLGKYCLDKVQYITKISTLWKTYLYGICTED